MLLQVLISRVCYYISSNHYYLQPLRPRPLENCPEQIESPLCRDWATNADNRPTASEYHETMLKLQQLYPGAL